MFRVPLLIAAASLALATSGCADSADRAPEAATLTVRGLYIESMYDGQAMRVDHEAIPDRMPAMRMPFRVRDPAVLVGIEEGGPVRLTVDSVSLVVVGVEALPARTVLDLDPGLDDGSGVIILPPDEATNQDGTR